MNKLVIMKLYRNEESQGDFHDINFDNYTKMYNELENYAKSLNIDLYFRIINSSNNHFSYLTAEYTANGYQQVCGDITFTLYLKDNKMDYSLKGSKSSQRLIDTKYYKNL